MQDWAEGYVLHSRLFRETSLIVDVFTRTDGKQSLIFSGIKKTQSGRRQSTRSALLQPFQPLLLRWLGQRELKKGIGVERQANGFFFTGKVLFSAMYLNELLQRLLYKEDPHPQLYADYETALLGLSGLMQPSQAELETILREFELQLLNALGYQPELSLDSDLEPLQKGKHYQYDAEEGSLRLLQPNAQLTTRLRGISFSAEQLLAIAQRQWQAESLSAAKRLLRLALAPHLGDRPLKSRELFVPRR